MQPTVGELLGRIIHPQPGLQPIAPPSVLAVPGEPLEALMQRIIAPAWRPGPHVPLP